MAMRKEATQNHKITANPAKVLNRIRYIPCHYTNLLNNTSFHIT